MRQINQNRIVFCAGLVVSSLFVAGCSHDSIQPAPVVMMGVYKTTNGVSPVVPSPLAAPRLPAASAPRVALATPAARQPVTGQHASRAAVTSTRSANARKVHGHSGLRHATVPMSSKAKPHRLAAVRSPEESIPLDEPITASPEWVVPAPAEDSQPQIRPPAP